jgi:hypothetical protein
MNVGTRVRLLWVGLGTYLLILLNDIRYLRGAPLYIVVLGTGLPVLTAGPGAPVLTSEEVNEILFGKL